MTTNNTESKTLSKPKRINGAKKGKQFERDVANSILHIFPEAERMLEYQASKVIGVDIENTDRFKIQCKRNQTYAPIGRIKEVQIESDEDVPLLVTKGNRLEAMAVMPFRCLIEIMETLYGHAPLWSEGGKKVRLVENEGELRGLTTNLFYIADGDEVESDPYNVNLSTFL